MLANAFRVLGNYVTVFVETNDDNPIIDVSWIFTVWQQRFGRGSQRAKQSRNLPVMPADENNFALVICTQLSRQISGLLVRKAIIDWQFCRFCKRLHR